MTTKVCPGCSARIPSRSNFCATCGEEVADDVVPPGRLADEDVDRIARRMIEVQREGEGAPADPPAPPEQQRGRRGRGG